MSDVCVYFRAPLEMRGAKLRPLSQLRQLYPRVYSQETEKYRGREHIMRLQIPYLLCFWNDVIHLSIVHPHNVYNALCDAGAKDLVDIEWLEIPVSRLEHLELVYLEYKSTTKNALKPHLKYSQVQASEIESLSEVPELTKRHYKEELSLGKMPLFLFGTPHILTKGPVETADLNIFSWKTPPPPPEPEEPIVSEEEKAKAQNDRTNPYRD